MYVVQAVVQFNHTVWTYITTRTGTPRILRHQWFWLRGFVCQSKKLNACDHIPFSLERQLKHIETLKHSTSPVNFSEKNPDVGSALSALINFHQFHFHGKSLYFAIDTVFMGNTIAQLSKWNVQECDHMHSVFSLKNKATWLNHWHFVSHVPLNSQSTLYLFQ